MWDTNPSRVFVSLFEARGGVAELVIIHLVFEDLIDRIVNIGIMMFRIIFEELLEDHDSVFPRSAGFRKVARNL